MTISPQDDEGGEGEPMQGRLADKVAFITGAAGGQGRAAARLFASEGASLALVDLHAEPLTELVNDIAAQGRQALAIAADVANADSVLTAVDATTQRLGRIDILYNNAGIQIPGDVTTIPIDDWNRTLAVNLTGPFLCARFIVPIMVANGGGSIINTASTSGMVGELGVAAYGASKGGLIALTRHMAVQHARQGIRVNCICPGWVTGSFNDTWIEAMGEGPQIVDRHVQTFVPLGRQGEPDEIARAALFLASEESSLMTGQALVLDGGFTAQ